MTTYSLHEILNIAPVAKPTVNILVFKTNLTDSKRISDIESLLDIHPHIIQWNVDLDDCDKVLRIVSRHIAPQEVETMLLNAGYYCEELE